MKRLLLALVLLLPACSGRPEGYDTARRWQEWVNAQVRYVDHGEYSIRSWSEALVRGGDCDDQAHLLRPLLRQEGMETTYVVGEWNHQPHAWVEWTDRSGTVWILDPSQRAYPVQKSGAYAYTVDI